MIRFIELHHTEFPPIVIVDNSEYCRVSDRHGHTISTTTATRAGWGHWSRYYMRCGYVPVRFGGHNIKRAPVLGII